MAVTSGFFNSVNGDRKYNAEQMSSYFEGLVGDGVFENVGQGMIVKAGGGMSVTVGTGRALIDHHWLKNDSVLTLPIDASDVQRSRQDAVVVKLDMNERTMTIEVVKGTLGRNWIKLTNTESVKYLCLAQIRVPAKSTAVGQSNIIDYRGTGQCGYVTGLIKQVDTSELFLQYQTACDEYFTKMTTAFDKYISDKTSAFDKWFESLTQSLNVDTTLRKYQKSITVNGSSAKPITKLFMGIPEYEPTDILFVHIGGVLFVEGSEFTVSGSGADAIITLKNGFTGSNTVTFIVIKSVIGGGVKTVGVTTVEADGVTTAVSGKLEEGI